MNNIINLNTVANAATHHEMTGGTEIALDGELFTVEKERIYRAGHGEIENRQGLFVGNRCINVVSDKYHVHQPIEVLEQFREVSAQTGLQVQQVIPAPHRGGLIITAKYNEVSLLDEKHNLGVMFFTSHCSSFSTFMSADLVRIFCMNQIPALAANKTRRIFTEPHYSNALDYETIAPAIEQLPHIANKYSNMASQLAYKKMPIKDMVDMYVQHYKLDPEQRNFDARITTLIETYFEARGQKQLKDETAYKAFQAITYMNTHKVRDTVNANVARYTTKQDDSLSFMNKLIAA